MYCLIGYCGKDDENCAKLLIPVRQVERMVFPAHYSGRLRIKEPRGGFESADNHCGTGLAGDGTGRNAGKRETLDGVAK